MHGIDALLIDFEAGTSDSDENDGSSTANL